MRKFVEGINNKIYFSIASIKNRYPCKIIKVRYHSDLNKKTVITYQAVNRLNLRESTVEKILNDPMIIEKFHPTDAVKLGFLSSAEIFLKNNLALEQIQGEYQRIVELMFKDLDDSDEIQ